MFRLIPSILLISSVLPIHAADTVPITGYHVPTATAASSTFDTMQAAVNLTNGSGLDGARHDTDGGARTMWHTVEHPESKPPAAGLPASPAWVRFDFKAAVDISSVLIWNHNQSGLTDRGFRKTRIYGSADGQSWALLATAELAPGGDTAQTIAVSPKSPPKSVLIAADSNHGGSCYGLSEVKFAHVRQVAADAVPFPNSIVCRPENVYRHRADGKPGRGIALSFGGSPLYGDGTIEIAVAGGPRETAPFAADPLGRSEMKVVLPEGVAVDREAQVSITVRAAKHILKTSAIVPPQRQWTVYLLPHSHVDIGYTNTHDNVEFIHRRNIQEAIKLAKETADFPEGSRFKWDTEVAWPAERTLANGTESEKAAMLEAIRNGTIHVGASYINDNTSVSADEEFAAFFSPSEKIGELTGRKFDTIMQVDIPGMSWGVVPAAVSRGIPYVLLFNNGGDRVGLSMEVSHHPFWWIGPDGKSKVLCLQPGAYSPGAQAKGRFHWPAMMGQTDRTKLPAVIRTGNPRANFIDAYLWPTLERLEKDPLYPYDIFPMSWALADNMPVDADLPYAVRSWNGEYAYPRVVIANSHDIMSAFDRKFGDRIPSRSGEFTEYWSDGLGSAAKQTAMNRNAKERLIQADTLWSMLRPNDPAPRAKFDEAWRNVLMGSEHTWCYSDPHRQPLTNDILAVKFGFFQHADEQSHHLLTESLKPLAASREPSITVFNTLSWPRSGLVTLPPGVAGLADFPTQRLSSGETVFLATDVPSLGARSYLSGRSGRSDKPDIIVTPSSLDNGIVKVTLDPATGNIASLIRNEREYVKGSANSYHYLKGGNAPSSATGPTETRIRVHENGPVLASLMVESKAEGCNWLKREIRLLAGQPQVEIINTLDKLAVTAKEGVHFGFSFDIANPRTRMDIPWGVAEVDADFFPEANRNWICFQRWLDISNTDTGVTWTSPDAPTFEYGDIRANILGGATGSPQWIRKLEPSSTIYSWALNNHWHTNFPLSQSGVLVFRYGLLAHDHAFDAAAANRFGLEQARPLVVSTGKPGAIPPPLSIDNPRVVISSIRTGPSGRTVTLRSLSDSEETVTVSAPDSQPATPLTLPPYGVRTLTL
ncbi:MAG: glycosyl hydrolase [Verrucomicrobia bacterium]|nr:glycosyl hydrolase [Verrucomicrobiota bacterium]